MTAGRFTRAQACGSMPWQLLLQDVQGCRICAAHLPLGPRPVLQLDPRARILVVGQAPGRKAHASGVPFSDASGERLCAWMGLTPGQLHDPALVAIVPMGLCYPGSGTGGDLPPRPECAAHWHAHLLAQLPARALTLVLGQYAQRHHLPGVSGSVADAVAAWRATWPQVLALPHPSPRNNMWLRRHPWFENELLPVLRERVAQLLLPA